MSGGSFATMHSKLMLLFYKNSLRIVVPSANMRAHDYGQSEILENSVFLIDLPRLPAEQQGHAPLTSFAKELSRFLQAMKIHEDVRLGILNFDFTNTDKIRFVHTISGSHLGPASRYTGFLGLGRAVRELYLNTLPSSNVDLSVDMAISSVGAIDQDILKSLYRALHGLEPPSPRDRKGDDAFEATSRNFRIVFPSRETVSQSKGGPQVRECYLL